MVFTSRFFDPLIWYLADAVMHNFDNSYGDGDVYGNGKGGSFGRGFSDVEGNFYGDSYGDGNGDGCFYGYRCHSGYGYAYGYARSVRHF